MKKILFIAVMALTFVTGARAEANDFSIGAQFSWASKHSLAGLGAQLQYEVVNHLRLAPEFNYYFKNDGISACNANVNLQYVIPTSTSFAIYPLAGFAYSHYKYDGILSVSDDVCGANVGLGSEYRINNNINFYVEERFQIIEDHNQSVTFFGMKYTF